MFPDVGMLRRLAFESPLGGDPTRGKPHRIMAVVQVVRDAHAESAGGGCGVFGEQVGRTIVFRGLSFLAQGRHIDRRQKPIVRPTSDRVVSLMPNQLAEVAVFLVSAGYRPVYSGSGA